MNVIVNMETLTASLQRPYASVLYKKLLERRYTLFSIFGVAICLCQRSYYMRSTGPHIPIVLDHAYENGPARSKRGNLACGLRPWRRVTHGQPNNATFPIRGLRYPEMMAME